MLLDDIRAYLVSLNIGGDTNWPIFEGYFPDDSTQQIGLFETGGMPADTLGRENERVTFQVRIRAGRLEYMAARNKWKDVFNALQDSVPALGYATVQAMQQGPMIFTDDRGRVNCTTNFRVMKARE